MDFTQGIEFAVQLGDAAFWSRTVTLEGSRSIMVSEAIENYAL